MSYKLDQDTDIECRDEWAELDEYDFDSTPPLHSSSAHDYDPDEPYYTWNGYPDEIGEDVYSQQQLEQTAHPKQKNNYYMDHRGLTKHNNIDIENLAHLIFGKKDPPSLSTSKREINEMINKMCQEEGKRILKNASIGQNEFSICHVCPEYENSNFVMIEPYRFEKYKKDLVFVYKRLPDESHPSKYQVSWRGYAPIEMFTRFSPDRYCRVPTYRVYIERIFDMQALCSMRNFNDYQYMIDG